METTITIKYDARQNFNRLEIKDSDNNVISCVSARVYEDDNEAEIAAAVMKYMFTKVEKSRDFDSNEFDFNIKAIFRLLDTPNKW